MPAQITVTQQTKATAKPEIRPGRPGPVENPTWGSSDPSVAQVVPDPVDPLSALVVAQGVGVANISFSADARIGEGEKVIAASDTVTVVQGEAVGVAFSFGPPEEQPA